MQCSYSFPNSPILLQYPTQICLGYAHNSTKLGKKTTDSRILLNWTRTFSIWQNLSSVRTTAQTWTYSQKTVSPDEQVRSYATTRQEFRAVHSSSHENQELFNPVHPNFVPEASKAAPVYTGLEKDRSTQSRDRRPKNQEHFIPYLNVYCSSIRSIWSNKRISEKGRKT